MMPELRPEAVELVEKVKDFINSEVRPKEHVFHEQINVGKDRWSSYPSVIDELKEKLSCNYAGALKYFTGLVAYGDIHPLSTAKRIRQYLAREENKQILSSWLKEIQTIDFRKELMSVNIPCHFVYGQNDALVKLKINKQIHKLNSDFCISIINNCGHAVFISQSEEAYNRISKFLNERI